MTPEDLATCTGARIDRARTHAPFILAAMDEHDISTPARQAAFLSQIGHESGGLHWLSELWGPTPQQLKYEPPGELADKLGNTARGDGCRFKGHGWIQTTGRKNHRLVGQHFGVDFEASPELLAEPEWAARSAAYFWQSNGLNELADASDFITITRRINGGTNGLPLRLALWAAAKTTLGVP